MGGAEVFLAIGFLVVAFKSFYFQLELTAVVHEAELLFQVDGAVCEAAKKGGSELILFELHFAFFLEQVKPNGNTVDALRGRTRSALH